MTSELTAFQRLPQVSGETGLFDENQARCYRDTQGTVLSIYCSVFSDIALRHRSQEMRVLGGVFQKRGRCLPGI